MKKVLAINFGSTSSKVSYYEDYEQKLKCTINYPAEEIKEFIDIFDQYDYRYNSLMNRLTEMGVDCNELDAVVSRGGHTHPMPGGIYIVNEQMLSEIRTGKYGRHACDLGPFIAKRISDETHAGAFVVDPPITDEFSPVAKYSGLPEAPRKSQFHALNQRAVAKQYASDIGKAYEDLNLLVVHMGGGTSVAVHKHGKMVDANSGLYGGPFSTNRTGDVPCDTLVNMCFSGNYTQKEIMKMLNGNGGLMAYIGESDVRTVEREALNGNSKYAEAMDAMLYQTCKEIGAMATVLDGKVDAIVMTGGIVNSNYIVERMKRSISFITEKIAIYPGELEMQALAFGALDVLYGKAEAKVI